MSTRRDALTSQARLLAGALFFVCLTLPAAGWGPPSGRSQNVEPPVMNETAALQAVSLVLDEEAYVLKLKNASNKNINGYSIGTGGRGKVTVDLTIGDRVILPGGVFEERVPAPGSQQPGSDRSAQRQALTILAAFFEDGTSEGNFEAVAEIRHRRHGTKVQLTRILSLLEGSLASASSDGVATARKLKAQISSLSETPESGQHPRVKAGLRSAKEDGLTALNAIERSGGDPRKGLLDLKERLKKRIARL